MATTDIHSLPTTSDRGGLGRMIARFKIARSRRAEYHRVVRELDAYSDRELADIGFHRTNIRDIAWQAAYGR
ncbi:DUF1127 domain-containing protein [Salipiger mangrovisoli]|uniref:DUF1127 domain-containing protein n=1 Tax=Salipiger mangrovisoli TaxID=2865933 RepID=A0ABR9X2I5_9RHOB|nr:DUF1127 domain-containing protein [Salipiger mangrovisoli]MBE9637748.1 DUF1127 domain-containing protein [Salipiger mangrovisoli]